LFIGFGYCVLGVAACAVAVWMDKVAD
jgi:nitrate/nitrite transporter NarK